jgi:UDP-N-acetylmuramoylalanine--D-glutamate ligase
LTHALVLGAGVSGMAVARLARSKGVSVTIYDQTFQPAPLAEGFGFSSGQWDHLMLRDADLVIASPGFSERSEPVLDTLEWGLPLVSEIEYAWPYIKAPLVAVTGTNGKTTVTEATTAMLVASGLDAPSTGNIGAPLSEFADQVYDALVVELSSFQLRFTETFHPMAAVVTNVAPDHLDWHGSLYAYRQAKARVFANQTSSDLLVYDIDDRGATELVEGAPSRLYPISGHHLPAGGGGVEDGVLRVMDMVVDVADLKAQDPIHLANIACAAALAQEAGATPAGVIEAALGFTPGNHRRRVVAEIGGVVWVNDSKATNTHSALASIANYDSVLLIAGGLAKGQDVSPLAAEPNVRLVIGIGEAGPTVVEAAGDRGVLAGDIDSAVETAARHARPGDTVLLAPACASFDQFGSYAERGDRFAALVAALERISR